jgi:hypothetical protein
MLPMTRAGLGLKILDIDVHSPAFRDMVLTMTFLRHNAIPVAAALLAALAVMFVSTVSMACEAPNASVAMSMGADGGPCEQEAEDISCLKACLVFCHGLVARADDLTVDRAFASVRYPSPDATTTDFTREAEDPPPRT